MSVITQPSRRALERPPTVPTVPIWRLSVDQYHEMIRTGILTEDDPVELLEGWLVLKMSKNPPHSAATRLIRKTLERLIPARYYVDSQEPVTLGDSEPEPDVTVVRGDMDQYRDRHPGPTEVALLVEVSDATLERDRGFKKRLYAEASIAIYWIVNLTERQVEVYSDPSGPAEEPDYRKCDIYRETEEVPLVIDGREVGRIAVHDLLP
jgi:Uma2 family endonuclease